ncbi:hypothetical protein HN803_05240 [candidate division WWE3 bacterium]|jgi:metal-responsive CopG/Arc/MetJ family transcriptional regulator|nr:hypothetical protein [candidate division WWE3 bacterium]
MLKYDKKISLNLPKRIYDSLVYTAQEQHCHRSDIIRYAIMNELEKIEDSVRKRQIDNGPADLFFA